MSEMTDGVISSMDKGLNKRQLDSLADMLYESITEDSCLMEKDQFKETVNSIVIYLQGKEWNLDRREGFSGTVSDLRRVLKHFPNDATVTLDDDELFYLHVTSDCTRVSISNSYTNNDNYK